MSGRRTKREHWGNRRRIGASGEPPTVPAGPNIGAVATLTAALLGLLCGALFVFLGLRLTRRDRPEARPGPPAYGRIPESVIAELTVGVAAFDGGDALILVNRAAHTLGIVQGHGELAPELRRMVRQVRRDGVRREARIMLPTTDLLRRTLPVRVQAMSVGGSEVAVIAEDITEVERVEAVRRDFVGNIGHEIKTPVGAISLLSEAALDAIDDREAIQRFLQRLQHEAARLSRLVQELIELSRLQGGEPLPARTPVDLDGVIDDAIDRIRSAADAKEINVQRGGDPGINAFGNHNQLVTALGNLLENAVAYSGSETRIAVGVRRRDDMVEVAVTDEGIGIARQELTRIFERFYRADPARSRATGGTGLGLAIAKHIVENHGGEVTVSSRLGVGTTFTVHLPLEPGRAIVAPRTVQEVST